MLVSNYGYAPTFGMKKKKQQAAAAAKKAADKVRKGKSPQEAVEEVVVEESRAGRQYGAKHLNTIASAAEITEVERKANEGH